MMRRALVFAFMSFFMLILISGNVMGASENGGKIELEVPDNNFDIVTNPQNVYQESGTVLSLGLTSPIVGTVDYTVIDGEKYLSSMRGLNWMLGFTRRDYFGTGLPSTGGAGYFEWGTGALIVPMVGVGYTYRFQENVFIGTGLPNIFEFGVSF